jgi:O-acetyl-ADP-ribose deacetylase (regulator of RNase III)
VRGNLLDEPVEAIVNAANGHLAHGGGVATTAGKLPFKGVIHAVVSFPAVPAASSQCRSVYARTPTSRPAAPRRSVMSGYACATNPSSTPS